MAYNFSSKTHSNMPLVIELEGLLVQLVSWNNILHIRTTNSLLIRPRLVISNILHHISTIQQKSHICQKVLRTFLKFTQISNPQPPIYLTNAFSWGHAKALGELSSPVCWNQSLFSAWFCLYPMWHFLCKLWTCCDVFHNEAQFFNIKKSQLSQKKHERIPGLFVWDPWFYSTISSCHTITQPKDHDLCFHTKYVIPKKLKG